jgi:hypothetical protein
MPPRTPVYQLKVTLQESRPPIWRRIQVPADIPLSTLHKVLQVVMGWQDYHLHQFIVNGEAYGVPDPDDWLEIKDERRVRLNTLLREPKARLDYQYDFGDDWEHRVVLEKVLPGQELEHPLCITGKRACPPEDCGGVWGYENFLEAMRDPKHPEHEELLDWIGGEFDPEAFDLGEVNQRLQRIRA